jgi:hypothetical protein
MFGRIKHLLFVGNRSFLLVKPKKPLADWVNAYDDSKLPEESILGHKTLYMVESFNEDSVSEKEAILTKSYKKIFEHELVGWYEDRRYFPKDLSLQLFKDWFEYEFIEMCFDTLRGDIEKE